MFKLMIVEDEPIIRLGLKHYFSWEELEVHSIIEAENGKDGLALALREKPDLVITDIRMPEMDGLQMIEQIRVTLPGTLFIILTGFNDFEYAQRAIRAGGVHAFLLKPLEYEESLATIKDGMEILKQKRHEQQSLSILETEMKQSSKLRGSELVKLLLEDEHAEVDESMIGELCEWKCDSYVYQPFALTWLPLLEAHTQPSSWGRQQAEAFLSDAAQTLFPCPIPRHILTYAYKTKLYGMIALPANNASEIEVSIAGSIQDQLEPMLISAGNKHQTSLFMALGKLTSDLSQMNKLLHQTDKALYERFYEAGRCVFLADRLGDASLSTKAALIQLDENDRKRIVACLESGNKLETELLMQRLAHAVLSKTSSASYEKALAYLQELISVTIRFAHKNGIHIEGVYSEKLLNLTFVDDFPTLEALFEWLGRWMVHLGLVYTEGLTQHHQQDVIIFEHIESFIKQNIDQEITLQMVADRFFYNPSYLSRLFKRKLDKNYMRFVTEIRIQFAQECLRKPDYLITDVCTMCGYKSYKHFVKTFRSITNMTPTDYRKQSGW
ncbi:response regulator transcription factor [Paenibacillus sp. FJAT-27812]|uniref:response regulator transcription factor n=1 Tax=Paenibacillus sp. FJAT-27812 TaxID=1684143 RepID=UPI0006A76EE7|nr:response regulator [Paenibacillus sp. FJAT-27812]